MNFVINLEDGGSKEFFLASANKFIPLSDLNPQTPVIFKTHKALMKKMEELRPKYACMCDLYGLQLSDFEARRKLVQQEERDRNKLVSGE